MAALYRKDIVITSDSIITAADAKTQARYYANSFQNMSSNKDTLGVFVNYYYCDVFDSRNSNIYRVFSDVCATFYNMIPDSTGMIEFDIVVPSNVPSLLAVDNAVTTATNALNAANIANTAATQAINNAQTAQLTATQAETDAQTAITTSNNAQTTASTAVTNANNALSTANTVNTLATKAETDAQSGIINAANANSIATEAGLTAGNAQQTANQNAMSINTIVSEIANLPTGGSTTTDYIIASTNLN